MIVSCLLSRPDLFASEFSARAQGTAHRANVGCAAFTSELSLPFDPCTTCFVQRPAACGADGSYCALNHRWVGVGVMADMIDAAGNYIGIN